MQTKPRRLVSHPIYAACLAALTLAGATVASAQVTPTSVIGDSVSDPDSSRYSDISEAIKRYTNRDVPGAEVFLETARRKDPRLPPVGVMLAKLHLLTNNQAMVRPALEQAANAEPGDPEPYLLSAEAALSDNRTIDAEALFDKAISQIDAYDANAKRKRQLQIRGYRGRALMAQRRRNWEKSLEDINAWIKIDPENAAAYNELGQTLFMLKNPREGYEAFVKAKGLDEKLPNPYVSAAVMYERTEQRAEAMQAFERAYADDKANETTLAAYSQALLRAGDLQKATTILKGARETNPDSFNIWLLSGVAARMSGEPAQAEQYFTRALSIQPANRDVYNQLALLLVEQEDPKQKQRAAQFAQVNAQLNSKSGETMITLAWVLYQLGQPAQAQQALQQGVQLGGLSGDASYLVAKMVLAGGNKDAAKRLLTMAFENEQGIFVEKDEAKALLESIK
ncbi:lipoprotein NlpI [Pirellulimonas nuda]|uniref:Lipoprotein NlpI n=1 Tax=Pirellulimonas nuda TaxID=2528009 RepID=A0A518DA41_9BACT|nr:tetratricopeptide repeat protein [Pirellulimonas nuda]QDU88313.1 lipoprotein NlpI [Pirellulimonas nuda]